PLDARAGDLVVDRVALDQTAAGDAGAGVVVDEVVGDAAAAGDAGLVAEDLVAADKDVRPGAIDAVATVENGVARDGAAIGLEPDADGLVVLEGSARNAIQGVARNDGAGVARVQANAIGTV